MEINVIRNDEEIVVIPSIYKEMEKPPTFVFRSPKSTDFLNFMFGGENVKEAVCNCFLRFENKIELTVNGKAYEYNTYREFVDAGLSGDIALIHNECMNAMYDRLLKMSNEAKKTEKK